MVASQANARILGVLLVALSVPAFAQKSGCPAGYARFGREKAALPISASAFWNQSSAPFPGHGNRYFTFSIDSEISFAQGMKLLRNVPGMEAQIKKELGHIKLTRAELAQANKVSEAQLAFSVLRKGAKPNKAEYSLDELQPKAFMNTAYFLDTNSRMQEKYAINSWDVAAPLQKIFNSLANRDRWPVRADIDGNNVEFAHRTFDRSPKTFRQNVTTFEKNFGKPQTHVHIGMPANIPVAQFYQVLRALETRITLRLARENTGAKLTYYQSTFLAPDAKVKLGSRGVLKADLEEWKKPFPTHNVELRQHFSLQEAFDNVELGVTLAQNHERLKNFRGAFANYRPSIDVRVSNINGALTYAAAVLEKSPLEADRELLPELRKLIRKTSRKPRDPDDYSVELPRPVLTEVAKFLQRTKLDERLTTDLFLREP